MEAAATAAEEDGEELAEEERDDLLNWKTLPDDKNNGVSECHRNIEFEFQILQGRTPMQIGRRRRR